MTAHAVLAIEASSDACSVALAADNWQTTRFALAPREHTQLVLDQVHALLDEAGAPVPTAVAYGRGPGSFTGVRIAAAVAQGFALGHGLPVVGISSLAALAYGAEGVMLPALDARLGQIYWGLYDGAGNAQIADRLDSVEVFCERLCALTEDWQGMGSAWLLEAPQTQATGHAVQPDALPTAQAIAALALAELAAGRAPDAERAQPCYLRGPEIR